MNISEIREKYPMYKNKSDEELLGGIHKKFYSHVPLEKLYNAVGYQPQAQQEPSMPGWIGAADDINKSIRGIPGAIWDAGKHIIDKFPEATENIGQQLGTDPYRVMQNLGAGAIKGGHNVLNIPSNIMEYLGKKGIAPEELAEQWRLSDANLKDYDEQMGLEGARPGDAEIQGLGKQFMPTVLGAKVGSVLPAAPTQALRGTGTGASIGAAGALAENQNPIHGAAIGALASKMPEIAAETVKGAPIAARGAIKTAKKVIPAIKEKGAYVNRLVSDEAMAKHIASEAKPIKTDFDRRYSEARATAKESGVGEAGLQVQGLLPKKMQGWTSTARRAVKNVRKEPTLENVISADRQIRGEIAKIKSRKMPLESDNQNLNNMGRLQRSYKKAIENAYKKAGREDLLQQLETLSSDYLENYIPIKTIKSLKHLNSKKPGSKSGKAVMREIESGPEADYLAESSLTKKFPEINKRKWIPSLGSILGKHVPGATLGYWALKAAGVVP